MPCTAFADQRRIAIRHRSSDVALRAKAAADRGATVFIFDDATAQPIEIDFRGSAADLRRRLAQRGTADDPRVPETPRGPGRPKLGVVAREVTLLPRHWEWLNRQPGGASVALRKLVEEARRQNGDKDRVRQRPRDRLPLHGGDGGELRELRGGRARAVRRGRATLRRDGCGLAGGHPRSRDQARRGRARLTKAAEPRSGETPASMLSNYPG